MNNSPFGPKQLLIILTITLLLLMSGLVFSIIYAQTILSTQSADLSKKTATKDMGQLSPDVKAIIQTKLNSQKPVNEQLNLLYATNDTSEAVLNSNINKYSEKAGVSLKVAPNSFVDIALGNSRAKAVDVVFDNYVKYDQFYKFISYIDKSLPKMQIINLSIKRDASSSSDEIKVNNLKIAVYYK